MPFPRSQRVALQWLPEHPWVQPIRPHGLVHVHIPHHIQHQVSFDLPDPIPGCPHSVLTLLRGPLLPPLVQFLLTSELCQELLRHPTPPLTLMSPTSPYWVASTRWSRASPLACLCQSNVTGALQRPPGWPGPCCCVLPTGVGVADVPHHEQNLETWGYFRWPESLICCFSLEEAPSKLPKHQ